MREQIGQNSQRSESGCLDHEAGFLLYFTHRGIQRALPLLELAAQTDNVADAEAPLLSTEQNLQLALWSVSREVTHAHLGQGHGFIVSGTRNTRRRCSVRLAI